MTTDFDHLVNKSFENIK